MSIKSLRTEIKEDRQITTISLGGREFEIFEVLGVVDIMHKYPECKTIDTPGNNELRLALEREGILETSLDCRCSRGPRFSEGMEEIMAIHKNTPILSVPKEVPI